MGAPEIMPLPPASSPALVLAHPTISELKQTWALTHPEWGTALSLEEYVHREEYLTTVPLAKAGGVTHWILTTRSSPPDLRPVLSSCESLRKRALFTTASGDVADGIAHGVGSVFTAPEFRGKGYASKLLTMVRDELKAHQGVPMGLLPIGAGAGAAGDLASPPPPPPPVAFSFLFSDIGKKFYASRGWAAHPSTHLSFAPLAPAAAQVPAALLNGAGRPSPPSPAKALAYHHLAELCARDEALLRQRMTRMATPRQKTPSPSSSVAARADPPRPRTYVCLPPDLDTLLWHLMREDFITTRLFGEIPSIRGAVWGDPGRRVWAVWTRVYQAAPPCTSPNTLYILRLVVEDETVGEAYLAEGLRALLDLARREAREWATSQVQLWNPDAEVEAAMRRAGLEFEVVDREMKSIFSLMWYGEAGGQEDVVWVAGEKYNWC